MKNKNLLLVLIIAILTIAGLSLYNLQQEKSTQVPNSESDNVSLMEGWITYQDTVHNFTFLYPPEWERTNRGVINPEFIGAIDTNEPTESFGVYEGDTWVCPDENNDEETVIDGKPGKDTGWIGDNSTYRNICFENGLGINMSEASGTLGQETLTAILSTFKFNSN